MKMEVKAIRTYVNAAFCRRREHLMSKRCIRQLEKSMLEHGFKESRPILCVATYKVFIVIDGNHRLSAARCLHKRMYRNQALLIPAFVVCMDDLKPILKEHFDGKLPDKYHKLDKYIRLPSGRTYEQLKWR